MDENVTLNIWVQKNTRISPKRVTKIGNGDCVIDLKISGYEDFHTISYRKMILMLKMSDGQNNQPYNSLRNKIKTFSSICAAVNFFTNSNYTEEEFFETWGDTFVRFYQNDDFAKVFDIGFRIWSDDLKYNKILGSWAPRNLEILMSREKYFRRKFSIFDEVSVCLDMEYLKNFHCQYCSTSFDKKFNLGNFDSKPRMGAGRVPDP